MDSVILQQAGASAGLVSILLLVYRGIIWANHRRFASRCCGRVAEVEIDIEGLTGTTPPVEKKNEAFNKDERSDDHGDSVSNKGSSKTGDDN